MFKSNVFRKERERNRMKKGDKGEGRDAKVQKGKLYERRRGKNTVSILDREHFIELTKTVCFLLI